MGQAPLAASLIAIALVYLTASAQDGPWNHRVLLAVSDDGLSWVVRPQILAERASVPELFLDPDGRPTMLFVDAGGAREGIGAMQQDPGGSWRRVPTNLPGVDPNVVRLADGTYRAYVKSGRDGAVAAYASSDGLSWRPLGEVFRDARYRNATDPDVFETPEEWVMLVSLGPKLLRCTSKDGLSFTTDGTVLELGGSVSDTVKVPGGWRTFFHVNADPRTGARMRIRSAFTADGRTWRPEDGDRVAAPPTGPASLGVADPAPVQLPDGTWLMAIKSFIAPAGPAPAQPAQPAGIETHQVMSASSPDGLTWTRDEGIRLARASVPCAINDGDRRVLLYFVQPPEQPGRPETVACAVSTDGLRFQPEPAFRIEGLSTLKAVDPSIVKDEAGRFRLYYLASNHPGDPAGGPNPHAIHLALSDDGIRFRETGPVFEHPDLVDPDVFRLADQWLMYVFARDATIIARSADGLRFTYEGVLSLPGWGTTAPVTLPDGRLRLYAFDQRTPAGNAIRSFLSADGIHWTAEPGERLRADPGEQITDPFLIPWRGGYKMYFKSVAVTPRPAPGTFVTGQPADIVLDLTRLSPPSPDPGAMRFGWPWGVWTDGRRFAAVATHGAAVLIWNSIPSRDDQPPDLVLRPRAAGTPRNITSDGESFFALSDHNNGEASRPGTMVWLDFPSRPDQPPAFTWPQLLKGSFTGDGKLVLAGTQSVSIWNRKPLDAQTLPDLLLRPRTYRNGDGPDAVVAQGRLYVSNYNGNNVLVWNSLPERENQPPDFALGGDHPEQDTWAENFFIHNPAVATDGKSLFASSDFDRKLFVWRTLPVESGLPPDVVIHLPEGPWDNAVHGARLALAGRRTVYLWHTLPLNGEPPDLILTGRIGDVELRELTGVAMDARHFYLADRQADRIYVWEGVPGPESRPKLALEMKGPGRISSDGDYLAAAPFEGHEVLLWRVDSLGRDNQPFPIGGRGLFNLPGHALAANGRLFVADRGNNRVQVWNRLQDAIEGKPADALLGAADADDTRPGLGRNKLFMPGSLAYDGRNLWVGEFKFSTRILRFSPR